MRLGDFHRMNNITLTDDIKQDEPLAFLVFPYHSFDNDYFVFMDKIDARTYAMQQEELSNTEENTWPIYALWATRLK